MLRTARRSSPSLEGLSYGTATTSLEPEKTYTLEAGTKWDLFRNRLLLTGAIFRVDKTNARTPGFARRRTDRFWTANSALTESNSA